MFYCQEKTKLLQNSFYKLYLIHENSQNTIFFVESNIFFNFLCPYPNYFFHLVDKIKITLNKNIN